MLVDQGCSKRDCGVVTHSSTPSFTATARSCAASSTAGVTSSSGTFISSRYQTSSTVRRLESCAGSCSRRPIRIVRPLASPPLKTVPHSLVDVPPPKLRFLAIETTTACDLRCLSCPVRDFTGDTTWRDAIRDGGVSFLLWDGARRAKQHAAD